MVVAKKKVSKKKKVTRKKKTAKKTPARKAVSKQTPATRRKAAAKSRQALTKKLKADLKVARAALKVATATASDELKLFKVVAIDEIAVLKDKYAKALKQEQKLSKLSKKKAKKLIVAGGKWEKQQLAKIKKAAAKAKEKLKKK